MLKFRDPKTGKIRFVQHDDSTEPVEVETIKDLCNKEDEEDESNFKGVSKTHGLSQDDLTMLKG